MNSDHQHKDEEQRRRSMLPTPPIMLEQLFVAVCGDPINPEKEPGLSRRTIDLTAEIHGDPAKQKIGLKERQDTLERIVYRVLWGVGGGVATLHIIWFIIQVINKSKGGGQ